MHVFHIRGFSGLMMVLLAVLSMLVLVVLLPSTFMMVFWNALVFEAFRGPEIDLFQGFLLWAMTAALLKIIFKPEFKLQFQQIRPPKSEGEKPAEPLKSEQTPEASESSKAANTEELLDKRN